MKNQKFFFSVVAVLIVLGVFVFFFFGFTSQAFAKSVVVDSPQLVAVNNVGAPLLAVEDSVPKVEVKDAVQIVDANVVDLKQETSVVGALVQANADVAAETVNLRLVVEGIDLVEVSKVHNVPAVAVDGTVALEHVTAVVLETTVTVVSDRINAVLEIV